MSSFQTDVHVSHEDVSEVVQEALNYYALRVCGNRTAKLDKMIYVHIRGEVVKASFAGITTNHRDLVAVLFHTQSQLEVTVTFDEHTRRFVASRTVHNI